MTIDDVIESLYEAFATAKKPENITGCREGGDLTPAEGQALLASELRKTSPKLIEKFVNNSLYVGDPNSILFFLPRFFDLILQNRIVLNLPFTLFRAMKDLDLSSNQKDALGRAFASIIGMICDGNIDDCVQEWLEGASSLKLTLEPMLEILDHPSRKTAKAAFFKDELGYNVPSSGQLSRNREFLAWFNANIDQILDPLTPRP